MTAEIAVLNRNAVALAADSAVTLQLPEGPKIYQANKLFTLSKYRPVGIMLYGSADFLGVPWETVIKQYRKKLGSKGFATVDQYARDFFSFMESRTPFFPEKRQDRSIYEMIVLWVHRLRGRLRRTVESQIKNKGPVTDVEVREMFNEILTEDISHLKNHKVIPRLSRIRVARLLGKYGPTIKKALKDGLQNLSDAVPIERLLSGATLAILRDLYWCGESGIVIAGFGENESSALHALYSHSEKKIVPRVKAFLGENTLIYDPREHPDFEFLPPNPLAIKDVLDDVNEVRNCIAHGDKIPDKFFAPGGGRQTLGGAVNYLTVLDDSLSFIIRQSLLRILRENLVEEFKSRHQYSLYWKTLGV